MIKHNRMIGGIFLVSGTTVGAGMLALPTMTGLAGLIPAICLFIFFWALMLYTAFLILEVDLWLKTGSNLISMAKNTLGKVGEIVCWCVYLFLLYCLTTAYLAATSPILVHFSQVAFGLSLPSWFAAFPLVLFFGYFLYEGAKYVDLVNRFLMFGLIVAYVVMISFLIPDVDTALLQYKNFSSLKFSVSLAATSFGFHIVIPTLTAYMHKNVWELKKAIFIGSLIPLIVYIIWEVAALGILERDVIAHGMEEGLSGAEMLAIQLESRTMVKITEAFSFFAVVTSLLGVTLSLSDFLADGFRIKKTKFGKIFLMALTFIPPLSFTLINPRAFLTALDYAGAFGVVILLILMPPLMVWSGRYYKGYVSVYQAPGGKPALILNIVAALSILTFVIWSKL